MTVADRQTTAAVHAAGGARGAEAAREVTLSWEVGGLLAGGLEALLGGAEGGNRGGPVSSAVEVRVVRRARGVAEVASAVVRRGGRVVVIEDGAGRAGEWRVCGGLVHIDVRGVCRVTIGAGAEREGALYARCDLLGELGIGGGRTEPARLLAPEAP